MGWENKTHKNLLEADGSYIKLTAIWSSLGIFSGEIFFENPQGHQSSVLVWSHFSSNKSFCETNFLQVADPNQRHQHMVPRNTSIASFFQKGHKMTTSAVTFSLKIVVQRVFLFEPSKNPPFLLKKVVSKKISLASEGNLLVSWLLRKKKNGDLVTGDKKVNIHLGNSAFETVIQSFIIDSPIDSISCSTKTCLKRPRAAPYSKVVTW